jgi:hypothetical protein
MTHHPLSSRFMGRVCPFCGTVLPEMGSRESFAWAIGAAFALAVVCVLVGMEMGR